MREKSSEVMVQWVTDSKAVPPVRAVASVIKSNGEVDSKVPITEQTRAIDVLKVRNFKSLFDQSRTLLTFFSHILPRLQYTKSGPEFQLNECGGNITRRRLANEALILPVLKVNPGLCLMVMAPR